ncbi:protoheme IX farnesyltransferase [Salpingoeca rosetta]|uniref:Protoheme IX farnesyltransferase, mitochondrial n=1 Tax=Salpingoeca rosetta (strain ATCC 50818 / BSB-021) TaxID=946362 RepID=F2U6R2_SALR5|nr:protoheme IX farnesyltransferase [Salpingoeca rosetta]EGD83544.1 protoheme IX farnesyltransferase [Salpingoeca rosetta]|eukprot:XP_004995048.1 protoheme IX farnesyltransferase [Salpingoeca rosetta]
MNSFATATACTSCRSCGGCLNKSRSKGHTTVTATAVMSAAMMPPQQQHQQDEDVDAHITVATPAASVDPKAAVQSQHAAALNGAAHPTRATESAHSSSSSAPAKESVATAQSLGWRALANVYSRLTKLRLSGLVVLTTMGGYALAPSTSAPFDWAGLGIVSLGTAFCVASANSFNQWIEVPYDAQMTRTCDRPLVRGDMSPFHAFSVAVTSGAVGVGILSTINPIVAGLGLGNIVLYAGIYTPMKRLSIANTWVGSVVGAIPPLMGWAAATGSLAPPSLVLAGILFAWQFPHFNALSWKLRPDYSKAGYRMMSVTDPALCRAVALRYSAALIPISIAAPALGLTDWTFAVDSTLINGYITYKAWHFYTRGDDQSARKLFLTSLWHLPAIMALLLVHSHFA